MRRLSIIIFLAFVTSVSAFASGMTEEDSLAMIKPKYWKAGAAVNVGFSQLSLTNWAAGGYNTLNLSAAFDAQANYSRKLTNWSNRLQLNYAFLWSADKVDLLQKSADRIYFESKWTYKTSESSKWNYSASFDFRSQFTDTKDKYVKDEATGKWDGTLKSSFFAPAYTNIALGIDWKPKDWFSVSFAPLTGGYTFVIDPAYRTAYSMKLKKEFEGLSDEEIAAKNQQAIEKGFSGGKYSPYRSHRFEFGAMLKVDLKAQINDKFFYTTQFVLFEDYLKDHKAHPCPRINWDNRIDWKLAKYFALTLTTNLIYDDMVKIVTKKHPEGGPAVQFKESIAFGFTYTISSKK